MNFISTEKRKTPHKHWTKGTFHGIINARETQKSVKKACVWRE